MFLKKIDKYFGIAKYIVSFISMIFIFLSCTLFVYWLLHSAKVVLPQPIENFIWASINLFLSPLVNNKKLYGEVEPILPVLASGVYVLLTYFSNCAMVFIENNHNRYKNYVQNYKISLEKKINTDLKKAFVSELQESHFMIVKIGIGVIKNESYLTLEEGELKSKDIERMIITDIISSVNSEFILKKGVSGDFIYYVLSEPGRSKEFFTTLVSTSIHKINNYMKPKTKISFYCSSALMDDLNAFEEKSLYLNKMLDLKIENKIVVSPRTKVYFNNLYPDVFDFKVLGEYNISIKESKNMRPTMLYSMHRKN